MSHAKKTPTPGTPATETTYDPRKTGLENSRDRIAARTLARVIDERDDAIDALKRTAKDRDRLDQRLSDALDMLGERDAEKRDAESHLRRAVQVRDSLRAEANSAGRTIADQLAMLKQELEENARLRALLAEVHDAASGLAVPNRDPRLILASIYAITEATR